MRSEIDPGIDRERQFDSILDASMGSGDMLLAAARQIQPRDAEMSTNLRLIALLHETAPAKSEIDAARLRIGQRLTREIFVDPSDEEAQKRAIRPLRLSEPPETPLYPTESNITTATSIPAQAVPRMVARLIWTPRRRRVLIGAVAAATLFLALGVGLSTASAQSLPDSPLYSVKRTEESILLSLPVGDSTHAQMLSMVAQRRLAEALAETKARHDTEAQTLLSQYNDDMRQLIMLAASVNAKNGDSSAIIAQITLTLQTQQSILRSAAAEGDTPFTQALKSSEATITATLKQQHITLPSINEVTGEDNGKGHNAVATTTPTIGPTPTAPGASGSHGHGHSNNHGGRSDANSDH
jgi:hypothetical protein